MPNLEEINLPWWIYIFPILLLYVSTVFYRLIYTRIEDILEDDFEFLGESCLGFLVRGLLMFLVGSFIFLLIFVGFLYLTHEVLAAFGLVTREGA